RRPAVRSASRGSRPGPSGSGTSPRTAGIRDTVDEQDRLRRGSKDRCSRPVHLASVPLAVPRIAPLRDCYALLGLVSFFTVGDDEVRAWSIPHGTRAQDAADAVHSDIARGFIRAEVNSYDALVAAGGSFAELRAKGQ